MHLRRFSLSLAAAAALALPAAPAAAQAAQPAWLQQRLAQLAASRGRPEVIEVWQLKYQGADAYLFVQACCDQHNPLHDAQGRRLCAPTGGFTGRGDGRCTEPLPEPAERVLLWSAARGGVK